MDTIRYFKDHSKATLKRVRAEGSALGLQQVQHQVATDSGFASWGDLLRASEADRLVGAVLVDYPDLNYLGVAGFHSFRGVRSARLAEHRESRALLRQHGEHVLQLQDWLTEHMEPRKTLNPDVGSYTLKHIAEDYLGDYVSNGELIAASILSGFQHRRGIGFLNPNVYFAIRTPSKKAARLAADEARQSRSQKWRGEHLRVAPEGLYGG